MTISHHSRYTLAEYIRIVFNNLIVLTPDKSVYTSTFLSYALQLQGRSEWFAIWTSTVDYCVLHKTIFIHVLFAFFL